jgi:nucleotide-binding universal stress UspA family protein
VVVHIERILCPVDFSAASDRALEHAVTLAHWFSASITALHVWPSVPLAVAASHAPFANAPFDESTRRSLRRELVAMLERAGVPKAAGHTLVLEGDPATEILRQAQETPADLVVMGTHGRLGLPRLALGSVTESVLRRAPCPVLSVTTRTSADAPASPSSILCAVDFSEASLRGLEFALSLAQEKRSRVVLLHVVDRLANPADEALFLSPEFGARVSEEARARLKALVPLGAEDWSVPEARVRLGRAAPEILAAAREERSDLIVMGAEPSRFVSSGLSPSTVGRVASRAECPVLAVPAPGRLAARGPRLEAQSAHGLRSPA